MLGSDALTQKTNELLAASAPGNPSFQPSEMQGMHHAMSGMEDMQHEKTGAAKMGSGEQPIMGKIYYTWRCIRRFIRMPESVRFVADLDQERRAE